jgi:hypothetical protein
LTPFRVLRFPKEKLRGPIITSGLLFGFQRAGERTRSQGAVVYSMPDSLSSIFYTKQGRFSSSVGVDRCTHFPE